MTTSLGTQYSYWHREPGRVSKPAASTRELIAHVQALPAGEVVREYLESCQRGPITPLPPSLRHLEPHR